MGKRKFTPGDEIPKKNRKYDNDTKEETETEPETPNVAHKTGKRAFDIKQFRKELTTKQGQTIVLTQFLQVCLNPDSDADYILEYIKAGGNSHEILRQIGTDSKKNISLATPVFHIFHLMILKVQSSQPHLIGITEEACRYFLNNFMSTVEIMIGENSGLRQRKIILKLLTSMVTLNSDLGIEVLNQAPLTPKHLQYILEKTTYKEKDNVRTAFVHFMTSFLVDGHLPLIKALLEKQGLLSLVIPGLVYDDAEAVLMFINILKKNIIENSLISKSLKLKTFSHNVLHQIFKIFTWKGPPGTSHDSSDRKEIIALLSDIVLTLFTSHKLGLYFVDSTLGTTDVNKNINLYKALLSLKRPWENPHQCDIILQILYRCPDLHKAVISLIERSFEPQHSQTWERTVEFVIKMYERLKPEDMIQRFGKINSWQVANFVRFVTLPVPLLKNIQASLGTSDKTISLYSVKLLVRMLSSLKRYLQLLELDTNTNNAQELKNKLEYSFPKYLPEPGVIVSFIQNIIQDGDSAPDKTDDYRLPQPNKADALISLIDLLLLYNDINPANHESLEGSIDIKGILNYSTTILEGNIALLKFKVVSLWLSLDSSAVSLQNTMFRQLFLIMLEVYTSTVDNTWIEAKDTIYKFFKTTSIFESDENEIHLMLYALRNCKVDATLIGDVIEYVLGNIESISEFVRNKLADCKVFAQVTEADLEKLFENLTEGKTGNDNVFLEGKTPSLFIVGCIQYALTNRKAKNNLKQFISIYVSNLLHANYSPELTELMLNDADLDVKKYITSWLTAPTPLIDECVAEDEVLKSISNYILSEENTALDEIFPFLEVAEPDDYTILLPKAYRINETLDDSKLMMWCQYTLFCSVKLASMNQLEQNQQDKISVIFTCLMELCKKQHKVHVSRYLLKAFLSNPNLLKVYSPISKSDDSSKIVSEFVLEIVHNNKDVIDYLNSKHNIFKPFQQKLYCELTKTLTKIKKRKNVDCEFAVKTLLTFGLSNDDTNKVLNLIFKLESSLCVKDDKEPSLALEFASTILSKYSNSTNSNLSTNVLKQVLLLYTTLLTDKNINANLAKFELALNGYFEAKPSQIKNVPDEYLQKFFNAAAVRKSTSLLASTLLRMNIKMCDIFKKEVTRPEILGLRELTLPLGDAMLHHKQYLAENKEFLNAIYQEYRTNIFKVIEKPHKAGQVYVHYYKFVKKLLLECADLSECEKVFNKAHKFEVVEVSHIHLLQATFLRICSNPGTRKIDYLTNYFLSLLGVITLALKETKDPEILVEIATQICTIAKLAEHLQEFRSHEKEKFQKITESAIWQNFCKAVLKDSLKLKSDEHSSVIAGPRLLSLLTILVKLFYSPDHSDVVTLFDMSTSHSEFLKVMLSHSSVEIKSRLIEFLFALIRKNNSIMKAQQIPVYLSAYGGTRSPCNRLILSILHYYETHGQPVQEYKPYLWGESAANYYAVRKNRTASLWSQPTPNQIINLFEKDIIERTLQHFPVTQRLEYNYELPSNLEDRDSIKGLLKSLNDHSDVVKVKDNETEVLNLVRRVSYDTLIAKFKETDIPLVSHKEEDETVYDPAFVFPLLSHMLAPGSVASCFKILRRGLLSVPVMALSSHCPNMRAAAYHVMHRFYMLLETETKHKNDKLLLTDFVDTLRTSLSSAIVNNEDNSKDKQRNPRMPAINALYLAKALRISTAPFEPVFKPVNNFLIAKQEVDLTVVPDFLSLFHDSDIESIDRRNWILDVIKDGTKTMTDVSVIFKTMCIKMIMDFYSSVLCDRKGKEKILGVIDSVVSIPRACDIMVEGYGIISWLHAVVRQINKDDSTLVRRIMKVIVSMLDSAKLSAFSKVLINSKRNGKSIVDAPDVRVRKDVEQDLLAILNDMVVIAESVGIEVQDIVQEFPNVQLKCNSNS